MGVGWESAGELRPRLRSGPRPSVVRPSSETCSGERPKREWRAAQRRVDENAKADDRHHLFFVLNDDFLAEAGYSIALLGSVGATPGTSCCG